MVNTEALEDRMQAVRIRLLQQAPQSVAPVSTKLAAVLVPLFAVSAHARAGRV